MLFHETHAKTHKRGTTKWLARHSNNNYLKTIFSCPKVLNINMKWHCGNSSLSGSISARYTDFKKRWLEFSELVVVAGKIPQKIPSQAAPLPARTTRWSCACQISFHWALGNIIFVNGATELWATPSVTEDLYLYDPQAVTKLLFHMAVLVLFTHSKEEALKPHHYTTTIQNVQREKFCLVRL